MRGEACPVCAEVAGTGQDNGEGYFVADLRMRLRLEAAEKAPQRGFGCHPEQAWIIVHQFRPFATDEQTAT